MTFPSRTPITLAAACLAAGLSLWLPAPSAAQEKAARPGNVTLERIYRSRDFFPDFFGPARWLADGRTYTTLERSREGTPGREIVAYNAETGDREVLVPASMLVPEGRSRPLSVQGYEWSADGRKLLVFTNSRRVWRTNTRGDYWVLDLDTGRLRQLGADRPESSLMFAKFDPAGERVGYVSENNLYVEEIASGEVVQLTFDGSRTIINGNFDWVYEEEFMFPNPPDGWRWSPDGNRIAYWQLDAGGIGEYLMLNDTDSTYSFTIPVQYPKVGTKNSAARIGVVASRGGETTWCEIPGDPRNEYIPRMEWAGDAGEVALQHMNRRQNRNEVILCDAAGGTIRTLHTETDPAYLDAVDSWTWLDGGKTLLWESESTGWRHLYRIARDGGEMEPVTRGEWEIVSPGPAGSGVKLVDEKGGWVYFMASPESGTERYLYRARLDGSGDPERLTPGDQPGVHSYTIAPGGEYAIHTYSHFGVPPVTEVVSLPDHRVRKTLVDNARLRATIDALRRGKVEYTQVDVGYAKLDTWMMFPPDFDPSKKYPVLFYAYSGPWAQTTLDRFDFGNYFWHLMLTQQGYIVASVDNRGTPEPRGREWRKAQYRKIGRVNSADQAAAARKIAELPYVDPSRIGIWGWSGGGGATLNALFRYPDVYSTGIAVAAVTNLKNYDTIYMERYMGLLPENEEDYRLGSPVHFADGLKGNLLIVHGTADDNVHYQNMDQLVNALIRAGKHFTMLSYPNRSHGIFEGPGTRMHLFTEMTRYLNEHMPPGGVAPETTAAHASPAGRRFISSNTVRQSRQ